MLRFTQRQVATGRYSSTSDMVGAELRLLEEHEARLQVFWEALIAGENIGEWTPFFLLRIHCRQAGEALRRVTRYALSPLARADLDHIWEYTSQRWDDDQAETYPRMIQAAINAMPVNPKLGRLASVTVRLLSSRKLHPIDSSSQAEKFLAPR